MKLSICKLNKHSLSDRRGDQSNDERIRYECKVQKYLNDDLQCKENVNLTSCEYCKRNRILVTGFSNGSFLIHELPDIINIHSLKWVAILKCPSSIHVTTVRCVFHAVYRKALFLRSRSTIWVTGSHSVAKVAANYWYGNGRAKRTFWSSKPTEVLCRV